MATLEQTITGITEKFAGKWKEVRSENLEAFFVEMGVNFLIRKMALQAKPEAEIIVNGTDISIGFKTTFKSDSFMYKLDEEVEITNDKGKFLCTLTYTDGKLVTKAAPSPGNNSKPMETVREINSDGEMETTFTVGQTVSKRIFARLPK
ncbi:fatty acid-binding protein, adipocyte [Aplysia californica]|uniref:Fatty acid-binding protein, adipocyte n=1 Tax=Aplysia californica TaxID=6500 RepID=A0ABM1AAB6_APLCA|nr:fatty acid-binding protein, adipocyte [Aplysia californica]